MFDFSTATIDTPLENSYITKPGYYYAKVTAVEFIQPADTAKNPYLSVTFETEGDGKVTDKFFITQKALGRLKALFKGVWGKEMTQTFKNAEEVANFFKAALLKKEIRVGIRVQLEEATNGKTYVRLPFFDFISFDIEKFEPKVIETSDPDYGMWILKQSVQQAPKTEASFVEKPAETWSAATEVEDDLPF